MNINQSPLFYRTIKKLKPQQKRVLDREVIKIIHNLIIGVQKKGALKSVIVYKFKIGRTQYLLAYRIKRNQIELIMIGPHENYYKDLKRYLS